MESRNANSAHNCVKCCRKRATAMRVRKSRFWRRWRWAACTATFVLSTYKGGGVDLILSTTSPKNVGKLQINPPMILAGKWANYALFIRMLQHNRKGRPEHYTWMDLLLVQGMPTMCQMELKTSWELSSMDSSTFFVPWLETYSRWCRTWPALVPHVIRHCADCHCRIYEWWQVTWPYFVWHLSLTLKSTTLGTSFFLLFYTRSTRDWTTIPVTWSMLLPGVPARSGKCADRPCRPGVWWNKIKVIHT